MSAVVVVLVVVVDVVVVVVVVGGKRCHVNCPDGRGASRKFTREEVLTFSIAFSIICVRVALEWLQHISFQYNEVTVEC